MTEETTPNPFAPSLPPAPEPATQSEPIVRPRKVLKAAKKPRKVKSVAKVSPPASPPASPKAPNKKKRASRKPPKAGAGGRGVKLDLTTALTVTAGMKPDDTTLFTQMAEALQKQKKASRARIVAALGKIFR